MEMDSSRGSSSSRSLDRSRQPTAAPVKKPRLSPDDANAIVPTAKARSFPPRPTVPDPRLRSTTSSSTERERDVATAKGGGPASYQQMQELVAQYNTALAELTFNSKPIITNLTIIAGENLLASKGIAATICANILEVPSEQKLPSLYLLDSIVKNIGRDYIKYFAARLPEVFCKAYKQVDSSIHPGMRHLFGTWKGVFPPATLQFIEKDLGFSSIVNGSSTGGTTARTDSQTQRPPHSIHVNPKYLEARHLLQQSNRTKGVSSKEDNIVDDIERPDRASASGSMRQWTVPSTKNIHRPPRELPKEPSPEKSPSLSYGDNKYVSDLSRYSDVKSGRSSKKITERTGFDVPWYEIGSRSPEVSINQRSKSDSYAQGSYIASRSSQAVDQQLTVNQSFVNKRNQVSSRNWKNSEEEEYMWDDMNSKLTGHGVNIDSAKGGWDSDDAKKHASLQRDKWTGTQWNKLDPYGQFDKTSAEDRAPYYRDIEEHHLQSPAQHVSGLRTHKEDSSDSLTMGGSWLGHRSSSTRQYQEPQLGTAFGHTSITSRFSSQIEGHQVPLSSGLSSSISSSFGKVGMRSHEDLPAAVVTSGMGSSSFSHSTPSLASIQNPQAHGLAVHEYQQSQPSPQTDKKLVQILGQLSHISPSKLTSNSFSTISSNQIQQSYTLPNLQPALSQSSHHINTSSASSISYPDMLKYAPSLQQPPDKSPQQVEAQPQLSTETERQSSDLSAPFNSNDPDIESSGQSNASSLLAAIMNSGVISNNPARSFQNFNVQPPLPSGPPPVQVTASSTPLDQFSLAMDTMPVVSRVNTPPLATNSARAVQPPLPPGPPPSSTLTSSTTNSVGINSNPLSSLLKSLVAKGLISSTADEPPSTSAHMPNQLPSQDPSTSAHSASVPDASSTPSSVSQLSLPDDPQVKDVALAQNEASDLKDLIGLEFKPEVIRRFHPVVIDALFDNLKHQCRTCGMRFQLQDQLTKHIAWHDSVTLNRTSRKWYINVSGCTAHNMEASSAPMDVDLVEPTDASSEKCEPMVPADESQSICALCGEPFEDFYCHVRDEWMYKGTTYMKQPVGKGNPLSLDGSGLSGLIVHAKCIQR